MNKFYRCIWSEILQSWIAVSEISTSHSKGSRSLHLAILSGISLLFTLSTRADITISQNENMYANAGFNANNAVFNLLGDAQLSGVSSQNNSQSINGIVTFNGQAGGSVITLNNKTGSNYTKLSSNGMATIVGNNITFEGGQSSAQGGALTAFNSITLAGSDLAFKNNTSSSFGGAIHVNNTGATVLISADKFTLENNKSSTSGGGIWTNGNVFVNGDLDLIGNESGGYGGAIRAETEFKATGSDKLININNNTTTNGGAGINVSGNINIEGTVKATNNVARNERGGVFRAVDNLTSSIRLSNLDTTHEFIGNKAQTFGGGMVASDVIKIDGGVIFKNNTAGQRGGALYVGTATSSITIGNSDVDVELTGNKAGYTTTGTTNLSGIGGAIYSDGSVTLTGKNIILNNNIATRQSGAIQAAGAGLFLTGMITAKNNYALIGVGGLSTTSQLNLTATKDSFIQENAASGNGGAFYIQEAFHVNTIYAKGGNITFSGNKSFASFLGETLSGGKANSLYLGNFNEQTSLDLKAETGKQISFLDPITSNVSAVPGKVNINDGTNGTVSFSGEFYEADSADVKSTITANTTVHGGTFELKDNVIYGSSSPNTNFTVKNGATLLSTGSTNGVKNQIIAESMTLENNSTISGKGVSELAFSPTSLAVGSVSDDTVHINVALPDDHLTLSGSKFSGEGSIKKAGLGTLVINNANQFGNKSGLHIAEGTVEATNEQSLTSIRIDTGTTLTMTGSGSTANLTINDSGYLSGQMNHVNTFTKNGSGTFDFNEGASIDRLNHLNGRMNIASGKTIHVNGSVDINGSGTILGVVVGTPALIADSATLTGKPIIDINGYNPKTDTGTYTLVKTTNGITGNYQATVGGRPIQDFVDLNTYLIGSSYIDSTGKNLLADYILVWNNTADNGAHGTFNITGENTFDIGAILEDKNGDPLGFGWDGRSLTKTGTGTLSLNGINTYTGLTDVQEGKLIVGSTGAHSSATITGNVDVHSGATLGGHGKILGDVRLYDGSTIAPGNSIGTLTVGNITFDEGSTYEFEVNQNGTADKINSTATATINGGTVKVLANGNIWSTTDVYTILSATGGVTGTYSDLTSNLAFLEGQLDYDANNVYLKLFRNGTGMGDIGGTENQENTGNGVDSLRPGNSVYDTIVSLDRSSALDAFDNLSGEIHANVSSVLLTNSRYVRAGVNQHLINEFPEPGNNLWAHTWVHKGHIKNDGNAQRTTNKGYGFLIGYDYPVGEDSVVGIAGGYEQTKAKTGGVRQSKIDVDAYHLMIYGKTKAGPIDFRGGLGYAYLEFDSERNIWVTNLQGKNTASYHGQQIQGFVEASHTFNFNEKNNLTPYTNLSYTQIHTNNFSESGNLTALKGKSHSNNIINLTVGVRGSTILGDNNRYQIYADLGALNRFGDKKPEATLRFDGGERYIVKGTNQGSISGLIGVGTNIKLKPNVNLNIGYEGEVGTKITDQSMKAKLEWRF